MQQLQQHHPGHGDDYVESRAGQLFRHLAEIKLLLVVVLRALVGWLLWKLLACQAGEAYFKAQLTVLAMLLCLRLLLAMPPASRRAALLLGVCGCCVSFLLRLRWAPTWAIRW